MALHMMKLVVGIESLEEFAHLQSRSSQKIRYLGREVNVCYTRYQPKDAEKILNSGGSIYRVIKGVMRCRQKIVGFQQVQTPMGKKCQILMDTEIIRTHPLPRRAFQGWRYLQPNKAPKDLSPYQAGEILPTDKMERELSELGLL